MTPRPAIIPFADLARMDLADVRALAERHEIGRSVTGWTSPHPETDPRELLLEYQERNRADAARFKITIQARQSGKSYGGMAEVVEDCNARKTDWMIAAPSERQALDTLDHAKVWVEAFDFKIADFREERVAGLGSLIKSAEITLHNGSRIRAVPGRPDTVRGRSCNVFLDEFDFFEDPPATWRALLPSITNPMRGGAKKIRLVTTPNGKNGAAYKIWQGKSEERERRVIWSKHLITIYHAVLMGLPVDIVELRSAMDDPEGWAQEFECEFLDGSSVLLPYDLIATAETREASEHWIDDTKALGPLYVGIDFGRTTDPTVCWTWQRVGDVYWTREVLVLRDVSTPDQARILESRIERARLVALDYTGPGIGLGDILKARWGEYNPEKHLFGKIKLCTFTTQFKRQLFPSFRQGFLAPCKVRIPVATDIREDFHEIQQVLSKGEYNYWSRRTLEGHSDRCTAAALGFYIGKLDTGGPQIWHISRKGRARAAARRARRLLRQGMN